MYCKYCGKPISDNAKFCGICGKEQETTNCVPSVQENKLAITAKRAVIFMVISLITELVIIILTFTDLFTVKIGNSYMSYSYGVNVFEFFDNAHMFAVLADGNNDIEQIAGGLIAFGIILLTCTCICVIYYTIYIHYLYQHNPDLRYVSRLGRELYKTYSLVPAIIYIVVSSVGMIVFSLSLGMIGSVSPNASLIIIYILTAVQFVFNFQLNGRGRGFINIR